MVRFLMPMVKKDLIKQHVAFYQCFVDEHLAPLLRDGILLHPVTAFA